MMRRATCAAIVAICGLSNNMTAPTAEATPVMMSLGALSTKSITVDDAEASGFARQRGISLEAAHQRLSWQAVAPDLADAVARDLADRSGGVWIDVNDGDRVKVGVVGDLDATVIAAVDRAAGAVGLSVDGFDVVPVRHALTTLQADNEWLGTEIARVNERAQATLVVGLRTDLNAIELQTPGEATLSPAQQKLVDTARDRLGDRLVVGTYKGRFEPRGCGAAYCAKPLRGGVRITSFVGGCTAGFVAQSKVDDKLYIFTAGHCGAASGTNAYWYTQTYDGTGNTHKVGKVWHWILGGPGDMAIVRIEDSFAWNPQAWVHVTDGPDTTEDETYHIATDKTSVLGMRICTTGSYYGHSDCGFVTQLGMTATYSDGVTVHNLGRASFCGINGDSGAPMYALHAAFGLQVGGFSECDSSYQGIRAAEISMNVDVLHANP